jgi:hypothetical protein
MLEQFVLTLAQCIEKRLTVQGLYPATLKVVLTAI